MGTPVEFSTHSTAYLSVNDRHEDFVIKCGDDTYKCNKVALVSRSPYFQIVCFTERALKYNFISFPEHKQPLVRAMMHYLKTHSYSGPVQVVNRTISPCAKNSGQSAGEGKGMSITFRSANETILKHFPKMMYDFILHGDVAIKASKLITHHELFTGYDRGFEYVAFGEYRCRPELLPLPIQVSLFIFLEHLANRHTNIPDDPTFHADMYNHVAVKYMFKSLKPLIANVFYASCQCWINTSLLPDSSFITVASMILQPLLNPRFGDKEAIKESDNWHMANALAQILAENWGWMRHDEDVRQWMNERVYRSVKKCVEREVEELEAQWRRRLDKKG